MAPTAAHQPRVIGTVRSMALDHAAGSVATALADEGVRAILLRGPAIARWLYDDGTPRAYTDVDLLISPDNWAGAERVLSQLGFHPHDDRARPAGRAGGHAATWSRPDGRVIDLHWSIVGVTAAPDVTWRVLSQQSETIQLADFVVEILTRPALALLVVLHALQHGVSEHQSVEDLTRLIDHAHPADWQQATALATELQATESFAAGLRLVPEGRALASRLDLPTKVSTEGVVRGEARRGRAGALGIEAVLGADTSRDRLRVLRRRLLPAPSHMRVRHPIARRGRTGLALAYGWRVLTLAPRGAIGLWAWARARRVAGRGRTADHRDLR